MFPAHSIWAECLENAADAMPEYSFEQLKPDFFLNDWRSVGKITPTSDSSKKHVQLQVHPYEYGGATFNDAQALMNQATEHRATLHRLLQHSGDPSPSWFFVTIYYWGLFIALAWSRLVGSAIVYLDKPALIPLFQGSGNLGAGGAYTLECGDIFGTSQRMVNLKKCSHSHFHEAVWSFLATDMYSRYATANVKEKTTDPDIELEKRIFRCLAQDNFKEAHVWPSLLRNAVNYRPGFSYTAVSGKVMLDICSYLREMELASILEVVESYENISREIKKVGNLLSPVDVYIDASKLLVLKTLLLSELSESILNEFPFMENPGMSKKSRVGFLHGLKVPVTTQLWPMTAS